MLILILLYSSLIYTTSRVKCQLIESFQQQNLCFNISGNKGIEEIKCPYPTPVIQVKISDSIGSTRDDRKIKITFQCDFGMNSTDYSLLPKLYLGEIDDVAFEACPLPVGIPIAQIIRRLGNAKIINLKFSTDESEAILPIHLEDLIYVQQIQLKNVKFLSSSKSLFSNLTNLRWMDLRSINANEMSNDIFKPLINLTTLELGGSTLKTLSPGMFSNQKNLKKLILSGNNLSSLPKLVFEGLNNLWDLDLSSNAFETFDSNSFSTLHNLTNINLGQNYLKILPDNLFQSNTKLEVIKIQSNRADLEQIPKGLFSNLPNLKIITLERDGINFLPEDLFKNSSNIIRLEIIENFIEALPDDFLRDQTNLKTLILRQNKLKQLNEFLFTNTILEFLDVSNNQLSTLSPNTFQGLSNLKKLYLQNNKLVNFESDVMEPLKSLKIIYLQNNQLSFGNLDISFGSPLSKLSTIEEINLRNNSVGQIYPDWYTTFVHLKVLDLSFNNIKRLEFQDLQFTRSHMILNLTFNQIETILLNNNFAFENILSTTNLDSVIEIDVNNNPLNCDCSILEFVMNIRHKFFKQFAFKYENLICDSLPMDWPYNLTGRDIANVSPRELVCPRTKFCPKLCSCWFRSFDQSLLVNCSNLGLTEVPTLENITSDESVNWIELHIENNHITELPTITADEGYNRIQELYAQNNDISELKSDGIPRFLRILNLTKNYLSRVNQTELTTLKETNLSSLSLAGNPWICSCETEEFISFIRNHHNIIHDFNQLKCEDGKAFASLKLFDICRNDNSLIIAICCVVIMLAILMGVVTALYYKYQLEFKLWLFEHNFFIRYITEEDLDKNKKYDAFISYSHKDESFVTDELVPKLENEPFFFKLCVHIRDWVAGELIQNQILTSVENSRRTIVVLSKNFLESVWGQMEFRTAHTAALTEGRARVIIIIYGDIGDIEKLDPNLKVYLKTNTYAKWGDPWFWNKLRYAMPHHKNLKKNLKK